MGAAPLNAPYDGWPPEELGRHLGVPRCLCAAVLDSAMNVVHHEALHGAPTGMLVLADEQRAGRGRRGGLWHSAPGRGVLLGYLARPNGRVESGVLALRVGAAVGDAMGDLGVRVAIKWPNDIVAHDRKLAGVLCEARVAGDGSAWVAVGVGINVHGPVPEAVRETAIALDELLPGVERVGALEALVPKLRGLSDRPTLTDEEREVFERRDWLHGRRVVAPVVGIAAGVAPDGALLVQTETTIERIVGGSIVSA